MKRTWTVHRTVVPCAEGQRRWDEAYQLLLQWTAALPPQEEPDASGGRLRTGVDRAPATGAND